MTSTQLTRSVPVNVPRLGCIGAIGLAEIDAAMGTC
jgi:hypothetical protein